MIENSEDFFHRNTPSTFVRTSTYYMPSRRYTPKQFFLVGPPGEGKTTMAVQLLKSFSPSKLCVKVSTPEEFNDVLRFNEVGGILIDDIFGHDVVEKDLVKQWTSLSDMLRRSRDKYVIMTSRDYIQKHVKEELGETVFLKYVGLAQEFNMSSKSLSDDEKTQILEGHLQSRNIHYDKDFLEQCLLHYESLKTDDSKYIFGFPQCVNIFTGNRAIFSIGPTFFLKPSNFLKACIEGIYKDMKQFLPLAIMWSVPGQKMKKDEFSELDLPSKSKNVHKIAQRFGFKLKGNLVRKLRRSLDSLNGFFSFDTKTGCYSFSHDIIRDMVGVVLSRDFAEVVIDVCSDRFLVTYATVDKYKHDGHHFFIEKHMFQKLSKRLVSLIFEPRSLDMHFIKLIHRGRCSTSFRPSFAIDTSQLRLELFENPDFIDCFIALLSRRNRLLISTCPILTMVGFFLGHGVFVKSQPLYLPSYALLINRELLFQKLWYNGLFPQKVNDELKMSLLVATHMQQQPSVDFLISLGLQVHDDALYIAAELSSTTIISSLTSAKQEDERFNTEMFEIVVSNSPLIAATKKLNVDSVRCLVDYGVEINYRNRNKFSALDKVVLASPPQYISYHNRDQKEHSCLEICRILLLNGASVNTKAGKFKRTPLHMAADIGNVEMVKLLLSHGANIYSSDHRLQKPIHCAIMRRNDEVVRVLLQHDPSQINLKLSYYSPMARLRGVTFLHLACLKLYRFDFLQELDISETTLTARDQFGRTPVYIACWSGNSSAVKYLLDKVDLNIADKQGYTPLHAAVNRGHSCIATLLYPRVKINLRDRYGKTAFHVACEKGNLYIVKDMLNAGLNLDIHILTKKGESVFHILAKKFHHYPSADIFKEMKGWYVDDQQNKWFEICELLRNYDPEFAEVAKHIKA